MNQKNNQNQSIYISMKTDNDYERIGEIRNIELSNCSEFSFNDLTNFSINGVSNKPIRDLWKDLYIDNNKKNKVDMPKKYIINHGATVLIWEDGEKTVVKRCEDDEFNKRLGFLTAFFQHYCGMSKNKANKFLAELEVEDEENKTKNMKDNSKNTQKSKFNIGDKVKLKEKISDTYGISESTIKKLKKRTFTISEISEPTDNKSLYSYQVEEVGYYLREDMIEKEEK